MAIIIHGATGAQGAPVAAALSRAGITAVSAVRTPSRGDGEAVTVDLADTASLRRAYDGSEGVFVHLPLGSPQQQMTHARNIASAVEEARPQRVVFSTSGYPLASSDGPTAHGVLAERLAASGVSAAVLSPRIYLENLLLPPVIGPAREQGVLAYPIREDYAASWTSHLDVADVAVRLFTDHTITGIVAVGALPGLVGSDLAAGFAAHLGREVTFQSQDPEDFGRSMVPLFGAEGIAPVVTSYHWRLTQPDELIDEATSAQRLLGLRPRTVQQWLTDTGA